MNWEGQVSATQQPWRIDEFLPGYDVRAVYRAVVAASVEQTYSALLHVNFSDIRIVRALMRLRGYGREIECRESSQLLTDNLKRGSFLELAIVPGREVLFGIVGKFWRPDGGLVKDLTPHEYQLFATPDYAKAVWNFTLTASGKNQTLLATETRVLCIGNAAKWKFRTYWLVIAPFSGVIRGAMLREVKRAAENKR